MVAENEFAIDLDDLIGELAREPELTDIHEGDKVDLLDAYRTKDAEVGFIKDDLHKKVTFDFESFGLKKAPTAVTTKAMVESDEKVIQATTELHNLKHKLDMVDKALNGHRVKQSSMKQIVQLMGFSYYKNIDPAEGLPTEALTEAANRRGAK